MPIQEFDAYYDVSFSSRSAYGTTVGGQLKMKIKYASIFLIFVSLIASSLCAMAKAPSISQEEREQALVDAVICWFNEKGMWVAGAKEGRQMEENAQVGSAAFQQENGDIINYTAFYDNDGKVLWIERDITTPPAEREAAFSSLDAIQQGEAVLSPVRQNLKSVGVEKAYTMDRYVQVAPYGGIVFEPDTEQLILTYALERISCMRDDFSPLGECLVTYSTSHDVIRRWDFLQPGLLNTSLSESDIVR